MTSPAVAIPPEVDADCQFLKPQYLAKVRMTESQMRFALRREPYAFIIGKLLLASVVSPFAYFMFVYSVYQRHMSEQDGRAWGFAVLLSGWLISSSYGHFKSIPDADLKAYDLRHARRFSVVIAMVACLATIPLWMLLEALAVMVVQDVGGWVGHLIR